MQPGEVGFAGMTVKSCPKGKHGPVLWCVCMQTPAQRAQRRANEWAVLKELARLTGHTPADVLRALRWRAKQTDEGRDP